MKVNLVGAIGGGNFGDEFILNSCIDEYLRLFSCDFAFSGFAGDLILKSGTISHGDDINFFECMNELRNVKKTKGFITCDDVFFIFNRYEKSDIIHFIGGGYLNKLWASNYALVSIAYLYGVYHGVPVYGTGLGLYPTDITSDLINLFESLDIIDVRDEFSHALISSSTYTGDDAILKYDNLKSECNFLEKPFLAVSVQSHLFNGEMVVDYIFSKKFLRYIASKGIGEIIIIEAAPEDTVIFSRENLKNAAELNFKVVFMTGRELMENGIPYHSKSKVISSRYHVNLLYTMLGLEGVSIIENEYYNNKHNSIVSVGGKWPVLNKEEFFSAVEVTDIFSGNYVADFNVLIQFHKDKKMLFEKVKNIHSTSRKKIATEVAIRIINDYV